MTYLELTLIIVSIILAIILFIGGICLWKKIKNWKEAQKQQYQIHCEKLDIIMKQLQAIQNYQAIINNLLNNKKEGEK